MAKRKTFDSLRFSPFNAASDNIRMSLFGCGVCKPFRALSRAAAKNAAARLRNFGLKPLAENWAARATVCERCPLRVVHRGVSYCGKPFLKQVERDLTLEGCGCPTREKAQSPEEHCPIDPRHQPAQQSDHSCTCKWCTQAN
jgi:hypothetical protein